MKKHLKIQASSLAVAAAAVVALAVPFAYAQTAADSEITQAITAGNLSTSIRNASGAVVPSPTFAMNQVAASTSMQTSTGTFGSTDQRITVDNASGGSIWTLALNVADPGDSEWISGSDSYPYNGATAAAGQLTVNPAAGTLAPSAGFSATGVSLGTQATFSGSGSITLATASAGAAPIWNGYITGIGLSQTIPASQPIGAYGIEMVQTVTAS